MKTKELRIGNWVYNTHGIPMIVKTIGMDYIYVDFENNPGDLLEFNTYNPFNPIHLTEEILLKCGFEYIESKNVYKLYLPNDNQLLIGFNFQNELRLYYKVFNVDLVEINYLHQLQNLFYCLAGKELNIKL